MKGGKFIENETENTWNILHLLGYLVVFTRIRLWRCGMDCKDTAKP